MNPYEQFIEALKKDKAERGYRPDMHVVGVRMDENERGIWLVIAFSSLAGNPSVEDVFNIVGTLYPDFEIDWTKSYGYKDGSLFIRLRPFIEKIPLKNAEDIPAGFRSCGSGIYSFKEVNGETSYWLFIKDQDKYFLVRKDGSKIPDVVTSIEYRTSVEPKIGQLVKTKDKQIGILSSLENGVYKVKLLGQTKEVYVSDVAEFDPMKEKELLREYYSNLYPADFVEALLRDYYI